MCSVVNVLKEIRGIFVVKWRKVADGVILEFGIFFVVSAMSGGIVYNQRYIWLGFLGKFSVAMEAYTC